MNKYSKLDDIAKSIDISDNTYYETEYNKVLNLYNIKESPQYDYVFSKVIYRNIYNYYNEITILKGSKEGIKEKQAVVNQDGLIGVVDKVYKHSSKVNLITNKDINVSVKINNTYGVLRVDKNNNLIVDSITNYDNVLVGDYIYTSGIGNLPANIYIGKVGKIESTNNGIEKKIILDKQIDFSNIDYVAILSKVGDANE